MSNIVSANATGIKRASKQATYNKSGLIKELLSARFALGQILSLAMFVLAYG